MKCRGRGGPRPGSQEGGPTLKRLMGRAPAGTGRHLSDFTRPKHFSWARGKNQGPGEAWGRGMPGSRVAINRTEGGEKASVALNVSMAPKRRVAVGKKPWAKSYEKRQAAQKGRLWSIFRGRFRGGERFVPEMGAEKGHWERSTRLWHIWAQRGCFFKKI